MKARVDVAADDVKRLYIEHLNFNVLKTYLGSSARQAFKEDGL